MQLQIMNHKSYHHHITESNQRDTVDSEAPFRSHLLDQVSFPPKELIDYLEDDDSSHLFALYDGLHKFLSMAGDFIFSVQFSVSASSIQFKGVIALLLTFAGIFHSIFSVHIIRSCFLIRPSRSLFLIGFLTIVIFIRRMTSVGMSVVVIIVLKNIYDTCRVGIVVTFVATRPIFVADIQKVMFAWWGERITIISS